MHVVKHASFVRNEVANAENESRCSSKVIR